jgi:hypothetical protein
VPEPDGAADGNVPVPSRRRRAWLLPVLAAAACLLGVLIWLMGPYGQTEAERYLSQLSVHDYKRVYDYIDPGTAPAKDRAAVAVFVGPPDGNVLARVSGPGLVVSTPTNDPGFPDVELVGHGEWHGCFVQVERWKTSRPLLEYYELTAEQQAAFEAGRLSVLSVAVGCGSG